ncbi:ATP-grasp domain-containing protein [Leifsonia sp. Leaf264]|uniref:ATP-grasp domain-containing protein n=1 Tax=Leifsonia sp. Leaf264 TaxID=1736314 RepID=UPI0006FF87AB|nr:alpha-L-glutamate ligase [Leifsonia sp. Leaf264]KQO96682.1 alpha-L-glutamate ligase [Leifsonia sp. Leaf264]
MSTQSPATLSPEPDGRPVVYALHENADWWPPFEAAFRAAGVPVREWRLIEGELDPLSTPPEGIFWSRISASSPSRDHPFSKDYARSVLSWVEASGRRTVNGRSTIEFEVSKIAQLAALRAAGFDTPATVAVVGRSGLTDAASRLPTPFITKHNQGGKGLGVRRFDSHEEFADYVDSDDFEVPVDGITLLQEYVRPAEGFITRVEIVGGEFVYAIAADTVHGGFQLCPADACAVDPSTGLPVAPPGAEAAPLPGQKLFSLRRDFDDPIVERLVAFTKQLGIEIAGIEFIASADGRQVVYDINTNTNYNADVEAEADASGPGRIARYLGALLREHYPD